MVNCQRHDQLLVVLHLDLDGFKLINDNFGHGTGDESLIALSRHMRAVLRDGDTLDRAVASLRPSSTPEQAAVFESSNRPALDRRSIRVCRIDERGDLLRNDDRRHHQDGRLLCGEPLRADHRACNTRRNGVPLWRQLSDIKPATHLPHSRRHIDFDQVSIQRQASVVDVRSRLQDGDGDGGCAVHNGLGFVVPSTRANGRSLPAQISGREFARFCRDPP